MKRKTKKIITEEILKYMEKNNIKWLQKKNPFPVSWRTISSIKKSATLEDDRLFSRSTQRKLLDFFKLVNRFDGSDYDVIFLQV